MSRVALDVNRNLEIHTQCKDPGNFNRLFWASGDIRTLKVDLLREFAAPVRGRNSAILRRLGAALRIRLSSLILGLLGEDGSLAVVQTTVHGGKQHEKVITALCTGQPHESIRNTPWFPRGHGY